MIRGSVAEKGTATAAAIAEEATKAPETVGKACERRTPDSGRVGIGFLPHNEAYMASRKHRVPDLSGLAHLVGVTGGWFYDLETLEAVLADGGRVAVPGPGGTAVANEDGAVGETGIAEKGRGGLTCWGPSAGLCQVGRRSAVAAFFCCCCVFYDFCFL